MVHWHRGLKWFVTTWDREGALAQGTEIVRYRVRQRYFIGTMDRDGALQLGREMDH